MLSISMVACALALMWINRMGAKWFSFKAEGIIINAPKPQERKKNLSYYFMFLLSVIVNGKNRQIKLLLDACVSIYLMFIILSRRP